MNLIQQVNKHMKKKKQRKIIYKITSKMLNVLLAISTVILIILVYNYVQTKILKKDYSNIFGYTAFKVISGSMADTINIDDIVVVKINNKNKQEDFKVNDIVVFKQDDYIITHRIIAIEGNKIITKGDANNTEDKTISKEQIIGKVTKVISNFGIWKKVFASPEVFISIIITTVLFALAFSVEDNSNNLKDDNNEN